MKELFKLLTTKKSQFFILFYFVLILPILIFFMAENITTTEASIILMVNFLFFLSLISLFSFCTPPVEKIIYFFLFVMSLIPTMVYLCYLLFANVLLGKNSIISLFETNPDESREFIAHYFSKWLVFAQAVYILLCFLFILCMKPSEKLKIKNNKCLFLSSLLVLILLLSINASSKHIYMYNFYRILYEYKSNKNYEKIAVANRQSIQYEVVNQIQDTVPRVVVVVIGESLTRTRMSLYGNYPRNTSPKLTSLADTLLVFKDVVSPQVHTIPVLRSVLTLSDIDHPEYVTEKPSLFELFNRAGFETYFISNQPFGGDVETSYDVFLGLAKHIYNVSNNKQPDDVVLQPLRDILQSNDTKNKMIVIHLIGNHMAYEFRYPAGYNVFSSNQDMLVSDSPFRTSEAKALIDSYDNSVLYNDHVVYNMIALLRQIGGLDAGLIYFSDHGEEVYDTRQFAGHAYEKVSTHMCEIPFLVWMSESYRDKRSDLVFDVNRPFSTANFLHSLSDFSGIGYVDFVDSLSLFSDKFKQTQRYVGDLKYEEIISMTQTE